MNIVSNQIAEAMNVTSAEYPEDSFEAMKQTAKERKFQFDYLVDETQGIAKKYGAMCTPDPFLFNSQKELVFHGKIDNAMKPDDTAYFRNFGKQKLN